MSRIFCVEMYQRDPAPMNHCVQFRSAGLGGGVYFMGKLEAQKSNEIWWQTQSHMLEYVLAKQVYDRVETIFKFRKSRRVQMYEARVPAVPEPPQKCAHQNWISPRRTSIQYQGAAKGEGNCRRVQQPPYVCSSLHGSCSLLPIVILVWRWNKSSK